MVGGGVSSLHTAQQNKHFKSQTSMNIITILRLIHPNPFVPLPLLSLDVLISVSSAKKGPFNIWCVFLPWRLLQNPHRTAAGIKTSLNIESAHTMELQTLSMLMNVSCGLIMRCGERSFLWAIFLTKYCWDLVHGVLLRGTEGGEP